MSTKDWLDKDYYKVLGVSKDAKPEDIKKAFRKLARENHPDQHQDDPKAADRFKEISEANAVLSDPAKRKEYDDARKMFSGGGFRFPRGGGSPGGAAGMDDLFRHATHTGGGDFGDLFGGLFGGGGRRQSARGPRRGGDVEAQATIDFEAAVDGTTVTMQLVSDEACATCQGTGAKPGSVPKVCTTCQGSGMQSSTSGGVFQVTEPCKECMGRGLLVTDPCTSCSGSGRGQSTRSLQVRIPAGVTDGQRIRIKGKGTPGENGGAAGDLYVTVQVRSHPLFGRDGDNLTLTAPITFTEAALGGEIQVPTLGGPSVRLRVAPGTPNGRTMRVRGKGVSRRDGTRGDLLITVEVVVPERLSDEARAALETYRDAVQEPNPRVAAFGRL